MRFHWQDGDDAGDHQVHRFSDGLYLVAVEVATTHGATPMPVAVTVRRQGRHDHGAVRPISGAAVARLPLGTIIRAAVAFASTYGTEVSADQVAQGVSALTQGRDPWAEVPSFGGTNLDLRSYLAAVGEAERVVMPRSASDHRTLLDAYDALTRSGERAPARIIAERLGISSNAVHQRLHRARVLDREGKLPPKKEKRR